MKRVAAVLIVGVAMFGTVVAIAGGARSSGTDPVGDSPEPGYDLKSASAKQSRNGRKLIHTVKMAGAIPADLEGHRITLHLSLDRDRDCEKEFHFEGPTGKNPLVKCGIGETNKFGRVTKPNAKTLRYTFKKSFIGRGEKKYKWRIDVNCGSGCTDPDFDSLPNDNAGGEKYIVQKLD